MFFTGPGSAVIVMITLSFCKLETATFWVKHIIKQWTQNHLGLSDMKKGGMEHVFQSIIKLLYEIFVFFFIFQLSQKMKQRSWRLVAYIF